MNWAPLRGYASPHPLQFDIVVQNHYESNNQLNGTYSRCSSLESPALLVGSSETSNISAIVATDQSNPLNRPNRREPSSSDVPLPSLGRISHLYQRFQAEGIPKNVADLLIATTLISTHKPTSLVGTGGAAGVLHKTDPLSSSISDILIFLQKSLTKAYHTDHSPSFVSLRFSVAKHPYVTELL